MNTITAHQVQLIRDAHALGHPDRQIAAHSGTSIATVKRWRKTLGLGTRSQTDQLARLGEGVVRDAALHQGLSVLWRDCDNAPYDMVVGGRRVDVKSAMQRPDGSWRFRLPRTNSSFYGQYTYAKNLSRDCDVVALVCVFPDKREPEVYLLESSSLPTNLTIRPGGPYEANRGDWALVTPPMLAISA